MIEFPETIILKKQLLNEVLNKEIIEVLPPTKLHKFCWFGNDVKEYHHLLKQTSIIEVNCFGFYVEMTFSNNLKLYINDGVNVRLININNCPKDYQLLIKFKDNTALAFSVAMYGGIVLHDDTYNNSYYLRNKVAISPLSKQFKAYYDEMLLTSKPNLSAKAFLATEQRFPGIGNGVIQDILFNAGINPMRKINTLSNEEKVSLYNNIITTLQQMVEGGGRDTEKDIYGLNGKYITKMSKNTIDKGCCKCHGPITKKAYLGGSVYFCTNCQR